ncbi:hypothetical protein ACP70R_009312 [Stipagrostis hirtigluma subsp. patula]
MSTGQDRSWMYSGWHENGRHSEEWVLNTNNFLNRAFEGAPHKNCLGAPHKNRAFEVGIACPCSNCRNRVRRTKDRMGIDLRVLCLGTLDGLNMASNGNVFPPLAWKGLATLLNLESNNINRKRNIREKKKNLYEEPRLTKAYLHSFSE